MKNIALLLLFGQTSSIHLRDDADDIVNSVVQENGGSSNQEEEGLA